MPGPIQSIERAAAVLRLLARGPGPLGVGEIAAALDLAKPTAHGILRTLLGVGFVDQEPTTGKYLLGPALGELGTDRLDVNELRSRAIHRADALAARSGESVRIAVARDSAITVIHHVFRPDNSEQTLAVGEVLPAHATALGKVLLAYDAAAEVGALHQLTHRTITERGRLDRVIAEVRRRGWADEVDERRSGEAGIAAPIRSRGGLVVAAIGITGPTDRLCDNRLQVRAVAKEQVLAAALAVHRDLTAVR
ncbi:IclR family transcriptional regulator [Nocardia alba]|uniref:Glycerol operon regulatory protein n=1 Tax=Nocardia alba TaxID=225051 RepID=A0A4R1FTC0_9NOCA|nr:IclR family transcriptional regulator [Nocardia alba]TCJ94471.1 IclR family transcriptional regulator [Nocardia alba]